VSGKSEGQGYQETDSAESTLGKRCVIRMGEGPSKEEEKWHLRAPPEPGSKHLSPQGIDQSSHKLFSGMTLGKWSPLIQFSYLI
jgi:hypothetical protein